jgi:hypothetical protein
LTLTIGLLFFDVAMTKDEGNALDGPLGSHYITAQTHPVGEVPDFNHRFNGPTLYKPEPKGDLKRCSTQGPQWRVINDIGKEN